MAAVVEGLLWSRMPGVHQGSAMYHSIERKIENTSNNKIMIIERMMIYFSYSTNSK